MPLYALQLNMTIKAEHKKHRICVRKNTTSPTIAPCPTFSQCAPDPQFKWDLALAADARSPRSPQLDPTATLGVPTGGRRGDHPALQSLFPLGTAPRGAAPRPGDVKSAVGVRWVAARSAGYAVGVEDCGKLEKGGMTLPRSTPNSHGFMGGLGQLPVFDDTLQET